MSLKSKIAKGIIGLVEDAVDLAVKKEVAPVAKAVARKAPAAVAEKAPAVAAAEVRVRPAEFKAEPRMEKRKKETGKIAKLEVGVTPRPMSPKKRLSVFDLEGEPFLTSQSDLSAGDSAITSINDVNFSEPVERLGGQDYPFRHPGSAWAMDLGAAGQHLNLARDLRKETGKDPLLLPWSMGPTAIDFAHMPRETMLRFAAESMGSRDKTRLAKDVRAIVPEFRALDDPASFEAFREARGAQRGALNDLLDRWRDRGGLGIGEARWANTDLDQIGAPLTTLRNVMRVDSRGSLSPSAHPTYRTSLPGEGLGQLEEEGVGALSLLPDMMHEFGANHPFDFPVGVVPGRKSPLRSMQLSPKGGVITDKVLRYLEDFLASKTPE